MHRRKDFSRRTYPGSLGHILADFALDMGVTDFDVKYLEASAEMKYRLRELVLNIVASKEIDLASKYEGYLKPDPDTGELGIMTEIDDEESVEVTGQKLAMLANFVADKTTNEIRESLIKALDW